MVYFFLKLFCGDKTKQDQSALLKGHQDSGYAEGKERKSTQASGVAGC